MSESSVSVSHDEILQLQLRLSTHIIQGRLQIVDTTPQSEEILAFVPYFVFLADFYTVVIFMSRSAMFW